MSKTKSAAGSITPAALKNKLQDNNISPDKKERNIHRSPIKFQYSFLTLLTNAELKITSNNIT